MNSIGIMILGFVILISIIINIQIWGAISPDDNRISTRIMKAILMLFFIGGEVFTFILAYYFVLGGM